MRTRSIGREMLAGVFPRLACTLTLAAAVTGGLAVPRAASALEFTRSATYQASAANAYDTLATGDFNADGIPDLAISTQIFTMGTTPDTPGTLAGDVEIFLGRGDGTFTTGRPIPIPDGSYGLAVGDFDGDHRPDLAVARGSGDIVVLTGRGDGTFGPAGAPVAGSLMGVVGDFNGDGYDDLVASVDSPSGVRLLLGGPGGTLTPGPAVGGTSLLACPAAGDLNGDGNLDLVCTPEAPTDGTIDVLLGRGDATFAPPISTPSGLSISEGFAVGDVNGDRRPDLVVASSLPSALHLSAQYVSVLLGRGDGTLGPAVALPMPDRQSFAFGPPKLADFNADGRIDILTSGWPASILSGNGDATFQQPLDLGVYDAGTAANAESSVVADFNRDGRPDVAALGANQAAGALQIYINGAPTPLTVTPAAASLGAQAIGDGKLSLIPIPTDQPVHFYSGPSQLVSVNNPGDGPTDVSPVTIAGADPLDFVIFNDFCSRVTLAAGHSCSFYVAFAPTAVGRRTADVVINDTASAGPHVVAVSGDGQPSRPAAATSSAAPAAATLARTATACTLGARPAVTGPLLTVAATCARAGRASVLGTVLPAPGGARAARRQGAHPKLVALAAGRSGRVVVSLGASDRRRLGRALAHHLRIRLSLTLFLHDSSGSHPALTRVDSA